MAVFFGVFFTAIISAVAGFIVLVAFSNPIPGGSGVTISVSTGIAALEAVALTFLILVRPIWWFFDLLFDFEYRHRRRRDDRRNGIHVGNSAGQEKPVEEGS